MQVYPAEFKYDNLIPGVRYYVGADSVTTPLGRSSRARCRDLGKIVVRRPNEDE